MEQASAQAQNRGDSDDVNLALVISIIILAVSFCWVTGIVLCLWCTGCFDRDAPGRGRGYDTLDDRVNRLLIQRLQSQNDGNGSQSTEHVIKIQVVPRVQSEEDTGSWAIARNRNKRKSRKRKRKPEEAKRDQQKRYLRNSSHEFDSFEDAASGVNRWKPRNLRNFKPSLASLKKNYRSNKSSKQRREVNQGKLEAPENLFSSFDRVENLREANGSSNEPSEDPNNLPHIHRRMTAIENMDINQMIQERMLLKSKERQKPPRSPVEIKDKSEKSYPILDLDSEDGDSHKYESSHNMSTSAKSRSSPFKENERPKLKTVKSSLLQLFRLNPQRPQRRSLGEESDGEQMPMDTSTCVYNINKTKQNNNGKSKCGQWRALRKGKKTEEEKTI